MTAATKPAAGAQEAREGISLAQYAAVRAAVAEGFPLADVLAVEGLMPRRWARADLVWKQRLAAEPKLLATYERELAQAEDWLERQVEPLAEDPTAWASFLAAFEAHPAPFELLQEQDLGMNDVARLRRRWARRAEKDAKVGEIIAERRTKPGRLGPLRIGPRVLRPSRVAQALGRTTGPADELTAAVPHGEPQLGLAEYAALCAELDALPEHHERVLRRHGLTDKEAHATLDRRWQAALAGDAALAKDFKRLHAHHARRLEMLLARARDSGYVGLSPTPIAAPSAPPAREVIAEPMAPVVIAGVPSGAGPLLDVPRSAAVPFAPVRGEIATVRVEPKPPRAAESLTGTAPLPDIPRGPALPFPQSGGLAEKRPPAVIAETAPLPDVPRGPALPFATGASGSPPPSAPITRPLPPRAPWEVAETSPAHGPPRGPVLPFASAQPARPAGTPVALRPAPRAPSELGETSLNLEIPRELLKQGARAAAPVTDAASQNSTASSRAGSTNPATLREPLETILPLSQYAALCAELALFPDAAEMIFRRHGLGSGEMRSAVDAAWKERLRKSPVEYARWQEMYWRHHARLSKRGASE
ncbi:hypothetical protein WMF31_00945 [Sorangium sp. So ce1036]|uniref:hypothetical protein n=1 Tax=Sorangium sp. So ce1036 TaxID=3133328 RepID=UPI003F0C4E84